MPAAARLWRIGLAVLLAAALLPDWIIAGRADPLFLLPWAGLLALLLLLGDPGHDPRVARAAWRVLLAMLGAAMLTWGASGQWPMLQLGLTGAALAGMVAVHRMIASLQARWLRAALHGFAVIIILLVGQLAVQAAYQLPTAQRPTEAAAPRVAVLSSLPLNWGESTGNIRVALDAARPRAPLLDILETRAEVMLVDSLEQADWHGARLLILIQPPAMTPAAMAALDRWVRAGGRVLWFADPALSTAAELPLGSLLAPAPAEPNGALLRHWGLDLQPPVTDAVRHIDAGGLPLAVRSAGRWRSRNGGCALSPERLIATCRIGAGHVRLIADADLLDIALWQRWSGQSRQSPRYWTAATPQWLIDQLPVDAAGGGQPLVRPVWLRPALRRRRG